jgi:hypothetical protein
MIVPGNTFLIPSGPGKHLFFVVLGPAVLPEYGKTPHYVLAGATTLREGSQYDPACIIEAGEHPFIRRRSYIAFRYVQILPASDVEARAGTLWTPHQDCDKALLARIISGILQSRHTKNYVKHALRSQHGVLSI